MNATARDQETSQRVSGVRVSRSDWAGKSVHAFHRWTGETELLTWCGIAVNLAEGGAHTKDHITCLQCAQGSLKALRG